MFDGYIGSISRVCWDMLSQCRVFGGICWVNGSCLLDMLGQFLVFVGIW